jgi:hypothetical protein
MPDPIIINIATAADSKFCTASEDGQKVHDKIVEAIRTGNSVQLSFHGVEDLTSAFLNTAVGQLYGEFAEDELRGKLLPPTGANSDDLLLLKKVVERAKEFFRTPDRYKEATREELGDEDDI